MRRMSVAQAASGGVEGNARAAFLGDQGLEEQVEASAFEVPCVRKPPDVDAWLKDGFPLAKWGIHVYPSTIQRDQCSGGDSSDFSHESCDPLIPRIL